MPTQALNGEPLVHTAHTRRYFQFGTPVGLPSAHNSLTQVCPFLGTVREIYAPQCTTMPGHAASVPPACRWLAWIPTKRDATPAVRVNNAPDASGTAPPHAGAVGAWVGGCFFLFVQLISWSVRIPLPPPLWESNALVRGRATARVVFARFGTMSYFAFYGHAPVSEQRWVLFPSKFGTLVLLSQGGGEFDGGRNEPNEAWVLILRRCPPATLFVANIVAESPVKST